MGICEQGLKFEELVGDFIAQAEADAVKVDFIVQIYIGIEFVKVQDFFLTCLSWIFMCYIKDLKDLQIF